MLVAAWADQLSNLIGEFMTANPWTMPAAITGFVIFLAVALIFGRQR